MPQQACLRSRLVVGMHPASPSHPHHPHHHPQSLQRSFFVSSLPGHPQIRRCRPRSVRIRRRHLGLQGTSSLSPMILASFQAHLQHRIEFSSLAFASASVWLQHFSLLVGCFAPETPSGHALWKRRAACCRFGLRESQCIMVFGEDFVNEVASFYIGKGNETRLTQCTR